MLDVRSANQRCRERSQREHRQGTPPQRSPVPTGYGAAAGMAADGICPNRSVGPLIESLGLRIHRLRRFGLSLPRRMDVSARNYAYLVDAYHARDVDLAPCGHALDDGKGPRRDRAALEPPGAGERELAHRLISPRVRPIRPSAPRPGMAVYGASPARFGHAHPRFARLRDPGPQLLRGGLLYVVLSAISENALQDAIASLGLASPSPTASSPRLRLRLAPPALAAGVRPEPAAGRVLPLLCGLAMVCAFK